MEKVRKFPLLEEDNSIDHPQLISALIRLKALIAARDPSRIAFFVGPTGWGKSHLARCLVRDLIAMFQQQMKEHPEFLPVAYMELKLLAGQSRFNWGLFYENLLTALEHPFPKSRDLPNAREKLSAALKTRRTHAIIIDEGHHIIAGYSDGGVANQAEVIKSLTQEYGVTWVFIGTYYLAPLVRYNSQLARRGRVVHRGRYRDDKEGRHVFLKILKWIDSEWPDFFGFRLAEHSQQIYEGCLGLVGILRDWLVDAFKNATLENESRITLEALGDEELDLLSRIEILREVRDGEGEMDETDADADEFATLLAGGKVDTETTASSTKTKNRGTRSKRHKARYPVGNRTPNGDAPGGASEA